MSLPARAACLLIRVYQLTLSPLLGNCCRFEPTCSHHGLEAIRRHGLIRGGMLAAWRVLRCNPFCRGGYDPVPVTFSWRPRKGCSRGLRRGSRGAPAVST